MAGQEPVSEDVEERTCSQKTYTFRFSLANETKSIECPVYMQALYAQVVRIFW